MSSAYLRQLQSDLSAYDISEANSPTSALVGGRGDGSRGESDAAPAAAATPSTTSTSPTTTSDCDPPPLPPTRPSSAEARQSRGARERAEGERRLLERESSILDLQARLRRAEHSAMLSQAQAMQERTGLQQQLHRKQAELDKARNEAQKALPLHRDWSSHLSSIKESLDELLIPESLYVEYRAIPRALQSVQQGVQCRVYELMRVERGHREALAVECEGMREQLARADSEVERLRMEREQLQRSKRSREADLTDEVRLLDLAKRRLAEEVAALKLHTDALQVKGAAYDGLQSRVEQLDREHRELTQQSLLHASTVRSLLDDRDALAMRGRDNEKKVELLTMDKLYLSSQLDAARERLALAERDRDRVQGQVDDVCRHKEQLVEQVMRVRDEQKAGYDDRLTAELSRLQERTQAELDAIRGRQREAYERELQSLRDARDAALVELTQLRALHADSAQALEQLRLEHGQQSLEAERQRAEHRATLQVRGFEYERLGLTTEEALTELRTVKGELEGELKKNHILRAECERAQREGEGMREKVEVYAALERELDLAIVGGGMRGAMKVGKGGGEGGGDAAEGGGGAGGGGVGECVGQGGVLGIQRILDGVGEHLPPSNRRRLQQSILLAHQLAERQRALQSVQAQLRVSQAEVASLTSRLSEAREQLEGVSQPHSYLVGMLKGSEEEVRQLREQLKELEGRLVEAERGRDEAVGARQDMAADVRRLTAQRMQLSQLKTTLQRARGKGEGGAGLLGEGVGLGGALGGWSQQTTVVGSPEPSRAEWSFASPAPSARVQRGAEARLVANALPPMWYRKLQQR